MATARRIRAGVLIVMSFWLSACILVPTPAPTSTLDFGPIYTQAVQTVVYQFTASAPPPRPTASPQPVVVVTFIPVTGLPPDEPPPQPTPTFTPEPTNTPLPPPPTPTPLPPPPTSTPVLIPCDWAQFVGDLSYDSNTLLTPGATFFKTWRFKNIGACTWTPDYRFILVQGMRQDGQVAINLGVYVYPGQTVDLTLQMTAPSQPGSYNSYWLFANSNGELFGVAEDAQEPFSNQITVSTAVNGLIYNFATLACNAEWRSGAGLRPCPSNPRDPAGFVVIMDRPNLENRREDEPTLWLQPNWDRMGWISGVYPPIRIQDGDRFQAVVGCLADSPGCDVAFQLDFMVGNNPVRNLGIWQERYDGRVTTIDVDLSGLAGQAVRFVISVMVQNNQPQQANAFWFMPHIQRR